MEEQLLPKKEKNDQDRQTFFKVTFKNHCNLLQIADNKANIVISINALVISSMVAIIGYGTLSHQLDFQRPISLIPILLLLVTCLISTILAVQAARPKVLGSKQNEEIPTKSSLLFFGVISNYTLEEYLSQLDQILLSKKQMHEHMSIALYYQGKVLDRKYRLLSYAYTVFIVGLAIGVITFLIHLIAL